jgi:hypothetical protein
MSWGFGGLFLMDGHTVSKTTRELTPTDDTLDFTVFLARGEHVMEAYGGENSGDEPTTWCFTYNPEFPTPDLDWGECTPFS